MKYKLVVQNNKLVVQSMKGLKVYATVGSVISVSHTLRVKQIELNMDLLSFWLARGIVVSTAVGRILDGIENVCIGRDK